MQRGRPGLSPARSKLKRCRFVAINRILSNSHLQFHSYQKETGARIFMIGPKLHLKNLVPEFGGPKQNAAKK